MKRRPPKVTRLVATKLHESARQSMESMEHNAFQPMLVFLTVDQMLPLVLQDYIPGELVPQAKAAIQALGIKKDNLVGMVMHADSYTKVFDAKDSEEALNMRIGDVKRSFEAGDLRTYESLVTTIVTREGTQVITQSYRYTPVDGWEWNDLDYTTYQNDTKFVAGNTTVTFDELFA